MAARGSGDRYFLPGDRYEPPHGDRYDARFGPEVVTDFGPIWARFVVTTRFVLKTILKFSVTTCFFFGHHMFFRSPHFLFSFGHHVAAHTGHRSGHHMSCFGHHIRRLSISITTFAAWNCQERRREPPGTLLGTAKSRQELPGIARSAAGSRQV